MLNGHIITAPAAVALQRLRGVPFVQYAYANEVPNRPGLSRFAMRRARATIVISTHTRDLALAAGCPADRLHLVPPGVDLPAEIPRPRRDGRPTIVTVARLEDRYKGHDVMLRSLVLVRDRVPDVLWVVVGDGSLRGALEAEARRLGVEQSVAFAGEVSDAERDRVCRRPRVRDAQPAAATLGGGGEGFGIAYLEAGLQGLPVVAGAVGGALDAVVDGDTGLLVDPTSPEALADALCTLLVDEDRARTMGEAGERRARQFSWQRMAAEVDEVLSAVLERA